MNNQLSANLTQLEKYKTGDSTKTTESDIISIPSSSYRTTDSTDIEKLTRNYSELSLKHKEEVAFNKELTAQLLRVQAENGQLHEQLAQAIKKESHTATQLEQSEQQNEQLKILLKAERLKISHLKATLKTKQKFAKKKNEKLDTSLNKARRENQELLDTLENLEENLQMQNQKIKHLTQKRRWLYSINHHNTQTARTLRAELKQTRQNLTQKFNEATQLARENTHLKALMQEDFQMLAERAQIIQVLGYEHAQASSMLVATTQYSRQLEAQLAQPMVPDQGMPEEQFMPEEGDPNLSREEAPQDEAFPEIAATFSPQFNLSISSTFPAGSPMGSDLLVCHRKSSSFDDLKECSRLQRPF